MTTLNGFSGTPTTNAAIDNIIKALDKYGLNCYRIAFTAPWTTGTRPYTPAQVQYFLDHCNHTIIVDRNHQMNTTVDWAKAEAALLEVCSRWPNNPRVAVEVINEYSGADLYTRCQHAVNTIRSAGYRNAIVMHKFWQNASAVVKLSDPQSNTYQGTHHYFNESMTNHDPVAEMNDLIGKGVSLMVNTEVGANYNEASAFTSANVKLLSDYLAWCIPRKVGNMIWMNKDLGNLSKYESLGLVIPPPPTPDDPCQQYKDQVKGLEDELVALNVENSALSEEVNQLSASSQQLASKVAQLEASVAGLKAKMDSARAALVY